jgi:large subunit ribosomal protein L18|tara:strand:- start:4410 stop:4997 length:588 start_codon:yes stop_codon:yes gene_type:complete
MKMAKGARYRVSFRRKRVGKTDYRRRVKLLLSRTPRLVVRMGTKEISAQLVSYNLNGDIVLVSAQSRELRKYGWKAANSNIPAAYLTGLLLGKRAIGANQKNGIFDIGFQSPKIGGKIFAVLKGALDAGLKIPHKEDAFPHESRIRGEHVSNFAELLKDNRKNVFSDYFKRKLDPVTLPKHFEQVTNKILNSKLK